MAGGRLTERVQFLRATLVDDGLTKTEVFEDHGPPIWADKEDVSGQEVWAAAQVAASVTTVFRVQFAPFTRDITPGDRLICDGREYDISAIRDVIMRIRLLEITAAARADQ